MVRNLTVAALLVFTMRAETVLVLPFANHSAPNLEWIGESLAESIRESLASQGLLVLDRNDRLEGYRRLSLHPGANLTHASIVKLGQALDASLVIYGEYAQHTSESGEGAPGGAPSPGTVRITGRVLDLRQIHLSPILTELGPMEDLPGMEVELAWDALHVIDPGTPLGKEEFVRMRPALRLDALESYARGLLAPTAEQRHKLFTQAARLDDQFSRPCFELGIDAWKQKDYKVAASWLQRVTRRNSHFFEAQFFLGLCRYYGGDAAGAVEAFQTVAEAVPLNEVYNDLGAAEVRKNDLPAAIAAFRKAIEGDDADPDYQFNLGYTQWRMKDYDGAVESLRAAAERDPSDTEITRLLGRTLKQEGPRPGDPQGRQRLKSNYEELAYRQLQAELKKK